MSSQEAQERESRRPRRGRTGPDHTPQDERHLPIWVRPEPGTRRPRWTREQIAAAALAIADAEGFGAVSMRRIARQLRSGTMSLYHYLETKRDLIDLMDDAIMGETLVPEGEMPSDWRGALAAIARHTCRALLSHPWAIGALQGASFGPNGLRHIAQSTHAVSATGLDQAGQIELLALVDDYVFGYVLRLAETKAARPMVDEAAVLDWVRDEVATGAYPGLDESAVPSDAPAAWSEIAARLTDEARFERGLQAVLEGARTTFGLP
jgi:AcrR family transcriptional regulator